MINSFATVVHRLCLDKKEIYDGIFDCINGEDEQLCTILEINECFDTDELTSNRYSRDSINLQCYQNSIFQYEELTERRYFNYLCNRREFRSKFLFQLSNGTNNF